MACGGNSRRQWSYQCTRNRALLWCAGTWRRARWCTGNEHGANPALLRRAIIRTRRRNVWAAVALRPGLPPEPFEGALWSESAYVWPHRRRRVARLRRSRRQDRFRLCDESDGLAHFRRPPRSQPAGGAVCFALINVSLIGGEPALSAVEGSARTAG